MFSHCNSLEKKIILVSDMQQLVVVHTHTTCSAGILLCNTEEFQSKSCVSREEFESLQQELNYWQNTTINILKKYLIDNEGMSTIDTLIHGTLLLSNSRE